MIIGNKPIAPNIEIPSYVPIGSEAAYILFEKELQKGKDAKFAVYGDPDIDGLFAGLIMESFLTQIGYGKQNENYRYFLNSNRAHGFFMSDEELVKLKDYLLIAVDFSITPKDFVRLINAGVNVIVLDHHEINEKEYPTGLNYVYCKKGNTFGVVVNNQYATENPKFRFLSGAGMVYYFIKYVADHYTDIEIDADIPAIVGITLLSDIRELETPEARSFLRYMLSMDSNYMKYLHWLVKKESSSYQKFEPFGVPKMCRSYIDFTFSPIINSLLRANKGYETMDLLRGNAEVVKDMRAYDYMQAVRDVQKAIISDIQTYAKEQEQIPGTLCRKYSNMQVICLPDTFNPYPKYNITNYIGVACSRIKDEDKTGVIFVINPVTHKVIRGSVRGGMDGIDYLSIFKKHKIPCAGHHNAFGILECDVSKIDFKSLNDEIASIESAFKEKYSNSRSVLEVSNLKMMASMPIIKQICMYNELSRDNYRIYLKYIGDKEPTVEKISDKALKYHLDDMSIMCFDPSLTFENSVIQVSFVNNKYVEFVLRPSFEYDRDKDRIEIGKKLQTLKELN